MRSKTLALPVSIIFLMTFAVAAFAGATNPDTLRDLAAARKATAQYQKSELPTWDGTAGGYVQLSPRIPGMGYHYANLLLMDSVFDVAAPEILLYEDAGSGRRLIAVEYVVAAAAAPPGFAGSDDVWHVHEASCHYTDGTEALCPAPAAPGDVHGDKVVAFWHPDLWTLHVWIWEGNPDGIFTEFNPNL